MHSPNFEALPLDQQHLLDHAEARLEREFEGTFGPETIERFIIDSLDQLVPTAKVTTFLPLLTERFARERLHALARIEGLQPGDRPSVLFMCVHNAGRSQMAAGWLRHLAGDRITVYSGGSEPTDHINPAAVKAMAATAAGLRSVPGSEPPDQAMARSPARWLNQPSAIWERPALWVHRNSTIGAPSDALPSTLASARSRWRANRSAKSGRNVLTVALLANWS